MLRLGVMVTLRDYSAMDVPGLSFNELLLFDGDLDLVDDGLKASLGRTRPPVEFVHAQEFMTVDGRKELVDLASDNESIRSRSMDVISRTRELARVLGPVPVVMHPGGIRPSKAGSERLGANLEESLRSLGPSLLLLENMPWHYWLHKSVRSFSNLCISVDDVERFAGLVEGLTLDVCHGYLSTPKGDGTYSQRFMARFGDAVRQLHVSDAAVPDKEGLQIGEGEVDFSWLKGSRLPMVVEIWNGHQKGAKGFRIGVERLRRLGARE